MLPGGIGARERHDIAVAFASAARLELEDEDVEDTVESVVRAASMLRAFVDNRPEGQHEAWSK
jgi:hypothetical protein